MFKQAMVSILVILMNGAIASAQVSVLGFQAWKTSRQDEARSTLERVQTGQGSQSGAPSVEGAGSGDKALSSKFGPKNGEKSSLRLSTKADPRLQQARLNLEIAQELTVSDYFVLYLSQFKDREAFVEAAKKLTPEDMADLLMHFKSISTENAGPEAPPETVLNTHIPPRRDR